MTILAEVYASAPAGELIIPTLEVRMPNETVRLCCGWEDMVLGVEGGQMVTFEACSLSISLPARNSSGVQTLRFGMPSLSGRAQRSVEMALESDEEVILVYREYLESDKSAPARVPHVMTMRGGSFEAGEAVFQAGHYDILDTAWPRERYTAETAPGIRFL